MCDTVGYFSGGYDNSRHTSGRDNKSAYGMYCANTCFLTGFVTHLDLATPPGPPQQRGINITLDILALPIPSVIFPVSMPCADIFGTMCDVREPSRWCIACRSHSVQTVCMFTSVFGRTPVLLPSVLLQQAVFALLAGPAFPSFM